MRIGNWVFQTIEATLIGVMSFCGTFAFISSKLFASFHEFLNLHLAMIANYTPLAIGLVLFISGTLLIMVKNIGKGFFTWLIIIFSLPSILSLDSIDLFRFIKLDIVRSQFTTTLSSTEILEIGVAIITCYLLINFMSLLRISRDKPARQGADSSGTDAVYFRSHLVLIQIMVIALLISSIIMGLATVIEQGLSPAISRLPWNIFFVGLGCALIIAAYIYWVVSRRKPISPIKSDPE